jgi:DAK2 domain fusion protein YloV
LSEKFYDTDIVDYSQFIDALENGVKCAYLAVPQPVEGTILTVVREAAEFVRRELEYGNVHTFIDVIDTFLSRAKISLDHTTELLEVLKSAGVVDSGGAGIIYVFEGMEKYLKNEALPEPDACSSSAATQDYSSFHRGSTFEFGYCTELLLQLLDGKEPFDYSGFRQEIAEYGDSLVTVFEDDKLKLHIHTATPEKVMTFCHRYGEFLALKIENMSVQHQELYAQEAAPTAYAEGNPFAVVAVAHNSAMKERFLEMGADHVILADYQNPPTASDFIDAFELAVPDTILVFPNNKNTELAAVQAQRLCESKKILVVGTRSDAQCYAALPMIDFDCEDPDEIPEVMDQVIENLDIILVSQVEKSACFDGRSICKGDYVAICDNSLKAVDGDLTEVCKQTIQKILADRECEVITMFTGKGASDTLSDEICDFVSQNYMYTEITVVDTNDDFYQIVFSFE